MKKLILSTMIAMVAMPALARDTTDEFCEVMTKEESGLAIYFISGLPNFWNPVVLGSVYAGLCIPRGYVEELKK